MDDRDDHRLAAELAERAGRLLVVLRDDGASEPDRGAAGDEASHRLLVEAIRRRCPRDAVLSEEAPDDATRLDAERVWIIDPLDGTREYAEGRDDWAVHVALWVRGSLTAAAVALPGRALVLSTETPPPPPRPSTTGLRFVVSRTRPPAVAEHVARRLGAELVGMGSAGAKVASVVLGEADAYIHGGGQYEWDSAAPVGVAASAGLHISRLDGSDLRYNQPDPTLPDLLVCRAELAEPVLTAIREAPADP